jgi:hypothetical protein
MDYQLSLDEIMEYMAMAHRWAVDRAGATHDDALDYAAWYGSRVGSDPTLLDMPLSRMYHEWQEWRWMQDHADVVARNADEHKVLFHVRDSVSYKGYLIHAYAQHDPAQGYWISRSGHCYRTRYRTIEEARQAIDELAS